MTVRQIRQARVAIALIVVVLGACGGEQPVPPVPERSMANGTSPVPPLTNDPRSGATATTGASAQPADVARHCPPVPACGKQELRCYGSSATHEPDGPNCDERCIPFDWVKADKITPGGPAANPMHACKGDVPLFCFDSGECEPSEICLLWSELGSCTPKTSTAVIAIGHELCGRNTCRLGGTCETEPGGARMCSQKD